MSSATATPKKDLQKEERISVQPRQSIWGADHNDPGQCRVRSTAAKEQTLRGWDSAGAKKGTYD